jgi:hypothetical protein
VTDLWFSQGTLVSSTNKTDRHNITEILLKVALNTNKPVILTNIIPLIINIYRCVSDAKTLFPGNVSIDIMFGRPNQTVKRWEKELQQVRVI